MKVAIIYYSFYGHIHAMAHAVAEGVRTVKGAEAVLRRVPETLPHATLEKMGALKAQEKMASVPTATPDDLASAGAIIFGTPALFGNMCGQMRHFLDSTGGLWAKDALVGKVGSVFTSTGTQHGGQESAILSFHISLLHHGMILVGLPYTFKAQRAIDEITGCSPYGASTIAGPTGARMPSENEIAGARFQGAHVASIAAKLAAGA
jgi:NAD(P)H dehydrogenase (quinone)